MVRILLLCTGNSCRSQMAEGWLRHVAGDRAEIYSAGVANEEINPRTIQVMAEEGIDISGHTSNHIDEYRRIDFDYVITLCDNARERCPQLSTGGRKIHHPFPDPADTEGTEEEILETYRSVRGLIRPYIEAFATEHLL